MQFRSFPVIAQVFHAESLDGGLPFFGKRQEIAASEASEAESCSRQDETAFGAKVGGEHTGAGLARERPVADEFVHVVFEKIAGDDESVLVVRRYRGKLLPGCIERRGGRCAAGAGRATTPRR